MDRALTRDEDERARVERELRVSEERLRAIFNGEPECVKVVDLTGCIVDMNAAGLAMLEADSIDQVRGVSVPRFVHPDDLPAVRALFADAAAGQRGSVTFRIRTLKGGERWAESHASPLRAGTDHVNAVLVVTHDVTERRRAREERDLYAQAMRAMNVGLMILQLEGTGAGATFRVIAANEAALRLTRMHDDELIGSTIDERFPSLRERGAIDRALTAITTQSASLIGDVSYGDDRVPQSVFNVALAPISERSLAITFQDVTEQRRLAEQVRQSHQMEAVGRLAGGVAHDFNNLLTIIIGYLQAGLASPNVSAELRGDLEQAEAAADRAARLTRQLLAFSSRQLLLPRTVNIDAHLEELRPMIARLTRDDILVKMHLGSANGCVKVDPVQLEHVVINLVVNACEAMPNGGTLTVSTDRVDNDGAVQLTIADTGPGMDDATRSRIFEPFFTTKDDGGTGLGLATVYGIVKQSGGTIECESAPGDGSRFHVRLPLVKDAADPVDKPPVRAVSGRESILVVEDQAALRRLMTISLERAGYHVEAAGNADEALALVRGGRRFDAMVTDLVMPGMNGRQLADALAVVRPQMQVVFVSGYFHDPAAIASFPHFLQKPFTPTALAAKVREALDQGSEIRDQGSASDAGS